MEQRQEQVRLETIRHRITGCVTLPKEGYRSRLSDLLNGSDREFLPLTDATVQPLDGGESEHHAFIALARTHIVFVVTTD